MDAGKSEQIETAGPGNTPRPKLAIHGKFYLRTGNDGNPSRRPAKRKPWMIESTMDLIIKRKEAVKAAAPWMQPAPLGALCFYINEEGSRLGQTIAVDRRKHIFCMFYGLGSVAFPLGGLQIKSDVVVIKTSRHTLPNLQKT